MGVADEEAQLTDLPTIPQVVTDTAKSWTKGLDNDYDRTLAIWRNLARGSFTYSLDVPYRDDAQSLADFLSTKKGFCQQFASLMAVMLRSIGIPARVAFGYNQGKGLGDDTYSVQVGNLHSWVEVPFQDYGWLGFDPSPAFGDPSAASYMPNAPGQDLVCPSGTAGRGCGPNKGDQTGDPLPHGDQPPKGGAIDNQEGSGDLSALNPASEAPSLPLGIVVGVMALVAIIAGVVIPLLRRASRRRRLHAARDPRTLILATYDVFGERAGELGLGPIAGRDAGGVPPQTLGRRRAGGCRRSTTRAHDLRGRARGLRAGGPRRTDGQ